jgi:hypothetical protein
LAVSSDDMVASAVDPGRGQLLAVGSFPVEVARGIEAAAVAVGTTTNFVSRDDLAAALEEDALAVVLAMGEPTAASACLEIRKQPRSAGMPILGCSPRRGDLAFTELFCWGGDDLIEQGSGEGLVRRLRAVVTARSAAPAPAPDRGMAVVAASDPAWRSVMGRTLHGAGYAVRFVATSAELEALAGEAKVVVAADDLQPDGAAPVARRTREGGSQAVWVVVAPPKRMVALSRSIRSVIRVAAVDSFAPPENVLFVLNELLSARGDEQRKSPRVLYGATVAFRAAGRDEDEVGFSYNVSATGLYVRTLAPPEPEQDVWIDLWPPRSERRVRLGGKVAWRRVFGERTKTGVPPGFGVQLTDGLAGDLERWKTGYEVMRRNMMGTLL